MQYETRDKHHGVCWLLLKCALIHPNNDSCWVEDLYHKDEFISFILQKDLLLLWNLGYGKHLKIFSIVYLDVINNNHIDLRVVSVPSLIRYEKSNYQYIDTCQTQTKTDVNYHYRGNCTISTVGRLYQNSLDIAELLSSANTVPLGYWEANVWQV